MPRLQRDVPATWRGPFTPEEIAAATEDTRTDSEKTSGLIAMLGVEKFSMRLREIGAHPDLLKVLPQAAWPLAEQLVGKNKLVWPSGDLPREMIPVDYRGGPMGTAQPLARRQYEGRSNRGVYCTFPGQTTVSTTEPAAASIESSEWRAWWKKTTAPRCHDDGYWGATIRLGAVLLLEDCPPVGGAFGESEPTWLKVVLESDIVRLAADGLNCRASYRCLAGFSCTSLGCVHGRTKRERQQVASASRNT